MNSTTRLLDFQRDPNHATAARCGSNRLFRWFENWAATDAPGQRTAGVALRSASSARASGKPTRPLPVRGTRIDGSTRSLLASGGERVSSGRPVHPPVAWEPGSGVRTERARKRSERDTRHCTGSCRRASAPGRPTHLSVTWRLGSRVRTDRSLGEAAAGGARQAAVYARRSSARAGHSWLHQQR